MTPLLLALLGVLLSGCAVALLRARNLFVTMALLSAYSGLSVVLLGFVGAVDVAFTEAVVGAGVSSIILMALVRRVDPLGLVRRGPLVRSLAFAGVAACSAVLILGAADLPAWGQGPCLASPEYARRSLDDMATPNVVTAVLADYRGLDTLIETTVILAAAVACALILRRKA